MTNTRKYQIRCCNQYCLVFVNFYLLSFFIVEFMRCKILAAWHGFHESVRILIKKNADVNLQDSYYGLTALMAGWYLI
jgi:hypothetical protein